MARVKGVDLQDHIFQRDLIVSLLGLESMLNKKISTFSQGQKRQALSALSMIGSPNIHLLDFPFKNVDFVAKEKFRWLLSNMQQSSSIMTTHNLQDAELFCDNLALVVNGRFVCYGPPEYIKNEYGQRIKLILRVP